MLKSIDKDWFFVYNKKVVKATYLGVAQLVACLNGVQEAASSNLATQTKRNPLPSWDSGFLLYWFILRVARLYLWLYCVLIFPVCQRLCIELSNTAPCAPRVIVIPAIAHTFTSFHEVPASVPLPVYPQRVYIFPS